MLFQIFYSLALLLPFLAPIQAQTLTYPPIPAPPLLEPAFRAAIHLGTPIRPIPIAGGFRGAVTILPNSTITGRINATVTGGIAYSAVYSVDNSTFEVPAINLYGVTNDGYPFVLAESGVGGRNGVFTSLSFDLAGPYRHLSQNFVLASLVEIGRTVWVDAYIVRSAQTVDGVD